MHVTLNATEQECFKYEHNLTIETEYFKQSVILDKLGFPQNTWKNNLFIYFSYKNFSNSVNERVYKEIDNINAST